VHRLNRYDELGQGVSDTVELHANRRSREEGNAEAAGGEEELDETA